MQPQSPKVSIIVPNYNYSTYLDARLKSIFEQTYTNFEVIILDDASTDGSRDVIEKYRGHEKIRHIVYNEVNSGQPCLQWEKGYSLAVGDYIWIAETDDFSASVFLEKAVKELDKHPDSVLFFCGSSEIDEEGKFQKEYYDKWALPRFSTKDNRYVFSGKFYMEHYMIWNNAIYNASGCVFRKSALDSTDWMYCKALTTVGDWALWSRIIPKGKVIICKEKLNYYRRHNTSATRLFAKQLSYAQGKIRITEDNIQNLPDKKRLLVIGRLRKSLLRHQDKEYQETISNILDLTFGKDTVTKAIRAWKINKRLIFTPWYTSQSSDHRKKEKTAHLCTKAYLKEI